MAIKPVSGEVKSQDINDNLSYLDTKTNQITGGPKGTFNTLSELKAAYPNGDNGIYVVSANGYWYAWDGSNWIQGNLYNATGVADGSITQSKLADKAGTLEKITSIGRFATVSSMVSEKLINFNYSDFEIEFPNNIRIFIDNMYFDILNQTKIPFNRNTAFNILVASSLRNDLRIVNPLTDSVREFEYIVSIFDTRKPKIELFNGSFLVNNEMYLIENVSEKYLPEKVANSDLLGAFLATNLDTKDISSDLDWSNSKDYIFEENNLTLKVGGYAFPRLEIKEEERIYFSFKKFETMDTANFSIGVRDSSLNIIQTFQPMDEKGLVYFDSNNIEIDYSKAKFLEFRFDNRNQTKQMKVENFKVGIDGIPITVSSLQSEKKVYVDGSVSNTGDGTYNRPFKTIQEGLDSQSESVIIKPMRYFETIKSINNRSKLSLISDTETEYQAGIKDSRDGVQVISAEHLQFMSDGNLFCTSYVAGISSRLHKVFISKVLPPTETNGRSIGYNACLWQIFNDVSKDERLLPVLTKTECENTVGSFYYDGSKIYVNPFDKNILNTLNVQFMLSVNEDNAIQINNVDNLTMVKIRGLFGYAFAVNIQKNKKIHIQGCEASYSASNDGFSVDYSNGQLIRCEAYRNRNDGFNFHFFGDTHLLDCIGSYNYDDGNSHHDGCTGSIHGGEYSFNGKGGCSPTYGAQVDIYDVLCTNNKLYGLLAYSDPVNPWRRLRVYNSVFKNNGTDIHLNRYTIISKSNTYDTLTCIQSEQENIIKF